MSSLDQLQKKYSSLTVQQISDIIDQFQWISRGSPYVQESNLIKLYGLLKQTISKADAKLIVNEVDSDKDGLIDVNDLLSYLNKINKSKPTPFSEVFHSFQNVVKQTDGLLVEYYQDELHGYLEYINQAFKDVQLKSLADLNDGTLFCKLVNLASPGTIDVRVISGDKNADLTLALYSAKSIGISNFNLETPRQILDFVWLLIWKSLVSKISLLHCPELIALLELGENQASFTKLSPEQILTRWINYHLKHAALSKKLSNFTTDLADSEIFTIVLNKLDSQCSTALLNESSYTKRAELMLFEANKLGFCKFVTPRSILEFHKNLNLGFIASLFNKKHGLPSVENVIVETEQSIEKQYTLWMNSLGADPPIVSLFEGIQNGLALLQTFEKIAGRSVKWDSVYKTNLNTSKCIENLNQAVEIGKKLGFSLANISGRDIYEKNKIRTLNLLGQMMRFEYLKVFTTLGGGARIKDEQIVNWVNKLTSEKGVKISGFDDPLISDSKAILTLIDVIKPNSIDWKLFQSGAEESSKMMNARYTLSIIRKLSGTVYAFPEDIVNCNAPLILTVYASMMAISQG